MNKPVLAVIAIGTVILGGGVYVAISSDEPAPSAKRSAADAPEPTNSQPSGGAMTPATQTDSPQDTMQKEASTASYVSTTAKELTGIQNDKRILFFHASWCPTCKALDADIEANLSDIPQGVTVARVDFDEETDLKKKYGVTVQHTLVQIDAKGNELAQWSGSPDLASLLEEIK